MRIFKIILSLTLIFIIVSCKSKTKKDNITQTNTDTMTNQEVKYPDRIKNSVIYEVNIRDYTHEGTFKAFEKHLPRLKDLGVDILWIMPIQPIGIKNRKGTLGSYYSIRHYTEVNPDYGTAEDFKHLVKEAHKMGMLVILDWVANHTAWDNPWITEHPDWYTHNKKGEIISPVPDWTDVADLNYDNPQMRKAMVDSMKFWVKNFDIDGFRCDVAMMVEHSFWDSARTELDKIKPMFMLAEAGIDDPDLMETAFDMNYSWNLYHLMNDIAKGEKTASEIPQIFEEEKKILPVRTIRMRFITNHDENAWNGTVFERMPDSYKTFATLIFTVPGMPLIYSGQEVGLNKRLRFFDKDTIEWKQSDLTDFYKNLIKIRKQNKALWTNPFGGEIHFLKTDNKNILAFYRQKDDNFILCIYNLSAKNQKFTIQDKLDKAEYIDTFDDSGLVTVQNNFEYTLKPWEYRILIKSK